MRFEWIQYYIEDLVYDKKPVKVLKGKYLHLYVGLNIIAPKVVMMCS